MDGSFKTAFRPSIEDLRPATQRILDIQTKAGAIAWVEDGPWDPWNHVESAMALCIMGEYESARRAYDFLVGEQRPDGAWLGEYGNAVPMVDDAFISREKAPAVLDSNFCAYPAVGVAHYLKLTGDMDQVRKWWPMLQRALDFVLTLQFEDGSICWCAEAMGTDLEDALLAGNASIYKSLECGLYLADAMGEPADHWRLAQEKLGRALRTKPHAFDKRGQGARFAMDWYYPALSGALELETARDRIFASWDRFVPDALGCRCVSDEPWITIAETAELVLTLAAIGERDRAEELFAELFQYCDDGGAFWMGWQTREQIYWPNERPSWTQAAVILAADALYELTPASHVLTRSLR